MGKPHKYAWNGIDVETRLSFEQLANMAQRAAQESTGDLIHGKHRVASVRSGEQQIEFRINDFLITYKKYLVFYLDFQSRSGLTWMSSRIDWYVMTQPTVGGFIPMGSKSMVGHHTYMQVVHNLAGQVRAADPQARVTIREGVAVAGAASAPASPTSRPSAGPPSAADGPGSPTTGPSLRPLPPIPPGARPLASTPPPRPPGTPAGGDGLVTSVPGMPRHEPPPAERPREAAPVRYASIAEQLFAEDEGLLRTQLVQLSSAALPWAIRLPDGRDIPLGSAVVLGRNPTAPPGSAAVQLALDDPARSVSKTHALLEVRDGLPWVTDLRSTNGTTLTNDVGEALVCDPGTAVPVADGWVVGLGEFDIGIVRRAARG